MSVKGIQDECERDTGYARGDTGCAGWGYRMCTKGYGMRVEGIQAGYKVVTVCNM